MTPVRLGRLAGAAATLVCLASVDARAQASLLPGRLEIAAAGFGSGPLDFGVVNAEQTTPQSGTATLFETSSRLQPAIGGEVSIGVALSRRFQIDGFASYGFADLRTRITGDEEGIPNTTVTEQVKQIALGGALTIHFPGWSATSRAVPFVSLGGAYLRDLHDGQTLVEEGYAYRFAGGLKYLLAGRTGARRSGFGIRGEVRAELRRDGVAFDDEPVLVPSGALGLFLRF